MYLFLFIAMAICGLTIFAGFYISHAGGKNAVKIKRWIKASVAVYAVLIAAFLIFFLPNTAKAATAPNPSASMAFISAALSTGLATIAAGYAVGAVGSSALGAVSEDPNILGRSLIFVGLAEGIAIYGLIISIMILGKV